MQLIEGHSSAKLYTAVEGDYDELTEVWEASVRETHSFLNPEDIAVLKREVREIYLPSSNVVYMRDDRNAISGFVGVAGKKIEMLFVQPKCMGKSIGKRLFMHAVFELKASLLDVNERNETAVEFYLRQGCLVIGRSAIDSAGRPYPILHMECAYSG